MGKTIKVGHLVASALARGLVRVRAGASAELGSLLARRRVIFVLAILCLSKAHRIT